MFAGRGKGKLQGPEMKRSHGRNRRKEAGGAAGSWSKESKEIWRQRPQPDCEEDWVPF